MSHPPNTTVRLARLEDGPAMTTIYNQGIEERNATFETEPRTVEQVIAQLTEKGERYPTVVVERDGQVVAWASAGLYRSRPYYAGIAEHSVYVERRARGTGGRTYGPLAPLSPLYRDLGFWKLVSRIFPRTRAKSGVA
jgi:phosphinothricin acetyltransferase